MPLGALSIPEIKFCGTLLGVDVCLVVHFYLDFDVGGDTMSASAFGDQMAFDFLTDDLLSTLSSDMEFHTLEVRDLADPDVFATVSTSRVGTSVSEPMPAFVAYGYKKNIGTRATRPGSMRIPGVTETYIVDGVWNVPAEANSWAAAIQDITLVSTELNDVHCHPIVVGRKPDGTYDLARTNLVTSVSPTKVTTQNSRKS